MQSQIRLGPFADTKDTLNTYSCMFLALWNVLHSLVLFDHKITSFSLAVTSWDCFKHENVLPGGKNGRMYKEISNSIP